MSTPIDFPPLAGWEPTRQTLHRYSQAVGAISRVQADPHPKWWHISLKVLPDGLVSSPMPLPQGGTFRLKMDLRQHRLSLSTSWGDRQAFDMAAGLSATAMGDQLLAAVADLGLGGEYPRQKFEDDEPRAYDPAAAERFLTALVSADRVLKRHRDTLVGETGPVQLWPHGFDLAFEWFGSRQVSYEHEGQVEELPAQINFGFYPGEPIYFYANPWPFEAEQLVDQPLPGGASWHQEGWQGSSLPYAEVGGDSQAESRLLAYFGEVYRLAAPGLMA